MVFAAIYVPDFPLQALVRVEPGAGAQPLAVVEGTPPLERVIVANEKAAEAGMEPGMTRVQAGELIAPEQVRRRSRELEAAAHAALLDCACGFSPRVEDTAADTILLDLAGLERIFGPPTKIARDIARRCSELGLEANVAVASNVDAAVHAARGFPGVTVIPAGKEAERLGSLPVDVLFTSLSGNGKPDSRNDSQEILDTLDRWGIRNLRALAALPELALTERLGQQGLQLQRLARGATSRPLVPAEPPLKFEEAMALEYPVEMLEPLAFILNRLLDQLCARLAARALATHELRLRLELEQQEPAVGSGEAEEQSAISIHGSAKGSDVEINSLGARAGAPSIHERTFRLPVPILDARTFLKLLQLDLQAHPPSAPVIKVWLSAEPAEPRRTQHGLFVPPAPEPEKLQLTLARIARVVAKGADSVPSPESRVPANGRTSCDSARVGSPELLDTHRPGAFHIRPFVAPAPGETSNNADRRSSAIAPRETGNRKRETLTLALRLFRPPLHAAVRLRENRPVHAACHEKPALRGDVVWAAGPWRTSGDWQEPQPWDREEWDIAIHSAAGVTLYRIYRDLLSGSWFVEGSYD